jgi:hypothetical protein
MTAGLDALARGLPVAMAETTRPDLGNGDHG